LAESGADTVIVVGVVVEELDGAAEPDDPDPDEPPVAVGAGGPVDDCTADEGVLPEESAGGSVPTPMSLTTAEELDELDVEIACGVPVESETTGALAIAPTSALTTGVEAKAPVDVLCVVGVLGTNEYVSRTTGKRRFASPDDFDGALYDGTRGTAVTA
jgi:hypothetical protein